MLQFACINEVSLPYRIDLLKLWLIQFQNNTRRAGKKGKRRKRETRNYFHLA